MSYRRQAEHHPLCSCEELSALELDFRKQGTRFRLFPQSPLLGDYQEPETVWISLSPDEIMPGPSDDRMYVADAIGKSHYDDAFLPPYSGPQNQPAMAAEDGHFDHIEVGTEQFEAAHMYGTLRWVLDIWETYFERKIDWSFNEHFERLELVPWLDWDNAHAGYGFIEMGYGSDDQGQKFPHNLNFDVLAHEFGHTMLYSVIGMPKGEGASTQYFTFHESSGDMVAIISMLHFNTVLDRLLDDSSGNLYVRNELNRVGELSSTRQIRMASNGIKMSEVPNPNTPREQLSYKQIHDISLPMTGALFDLLVEVFQQNLVDAGLISSELDQISRGLTDAQGESDDEQLQVLFDEFYTQNPDGFKKALVDARDYLGLLLSLSWEQLSWDLTFSQVIRTLFQADQALTGGQYQVEIAQVFDWREIAY